MFQTKKHRVDQEAVMGKTNIACSSEPASHSVVDSFNYIIQGGPAPLEALGCFIYERLIQRAKSKSPPQIRQNRNLNWGPLGH